MEKVILMLERTVLSIEKVKDSIGEGRDYTDLYYIQENLKAALQVIKFQWKYQTELNRQTKRFFAAANNLEMRDILKEVEELTRKAEEEALNEKDKVIIQSPSISKT